MFTTQVFAGNLALGVTDATLPAIQDQWCSTFNNQYMLERSRKLIRAFGAVPNGTAIRLSSPTWNRNFQPVIDPFDADATPGGNLPAVVDYMGRGPTIPKLETFGPLVSRAGAGAADCFVALWHTLSITPAPAGEIITVRFTANATGASLGWRAGTITFDQALPNGEYAVVGMRVTGANCLIARLNFVGGDERPGVICNVDATSWVYPAMRFGFGGMFGKFKNTNPPQIEVVGTGAVAAQIGSLDLIYTGPNL